MRKWRRMEGCAEYTPCCYCYAGRTIAASAQRTAATKEAGKVSKAAGRSAERSKERLLDLLFVSPPAARMEDARATDDPSMEIAQSKRRTAGGDARPRSLIYRHSLMNKPVKMTPVLRFTPIWLSLAADFVLLCEIGCQ